MPPPRGLASSPSQSKCSSGDAVLPGAAAGAGVHGSRPEGCRTPDDQSSLGASIPSSSAAPLPPGWVRSNVTTGLEQYSDGVDRAFTVKAAWELYDRRLAGRGVLHDNYAGLLKDWETRMPAPKNPGGSSSSSTTPAAKPPSQPSHAAHEGRGGKARMTSDVVDTGSIASRRPAPPPAVPDGTHEHSASKTPYRKSKSAWSIHLITNLQVDLDVPLDGVEPLSTPMHDLEVAEVEDEAMVHNREKEVAASNTEDIISSSEVFQCAIREKIKVTHASVLQHVEAAPLTCLPDTVQVLVRLLQKDRAEEAAYLTSSAFVDEAMQISRHASLAEAANTEQDAIRAGLQRGAHEELQYGSVLDFTGQPGGNVVDLLIVQNARQRCVP